MSYHNVGIKPNYYWKYLQSPHWHSVRHWAKMKANWKCQRCQSPGTKTKPLEVHHRHYQTLGAERPYDVMVLCDTCHSIEHGIAANDPQFSLFGDVDDGSG